jgi:Do/DeqQ family serine protease
MCHRLVIATAVLLPLALAAAGCARSEEGHQETPLATPPALPVKAPPGKEATMAPLIARVTPAVVSVAVSGKVAYQNPLLQDPLLRRFFGIPPGPVEREFQAAGSGVIVDADKGYVLTNNHVIQHADRITTVLSSGRRLEAKLVGTDPPSDVAVIQVQSGNLTSIALGNSDDVQVGDFVVAIGNPFGLSNTATFGIVSAIGRSGLGIEGYEDFIQTDASINPGNSGGALVNLSGEMIGVNAAIVGPAGGNVGIGFAIPMNMAQAIMEQLIRHGKVRRGQLGILVQDLTPELAQELGMKAPRGAVVSQVLPGSGAAKAGLQPRDVILAVDGAPIHDASDLRNRIALLERGQTAKLEILRDGKKLDVEVTVAIVQQPELDAGSISPLLHGVELSGITPSSPAYGRVAGVEVRAVTQNSPAWDAGLRQGDVVTSVNRQVVASVEDVRTALSGRTGAVLLHVIRDGSALFVFIS